MAVTNASAIQFVNEHVRPAADLLAKAKEGAVVASGQWAALSGTNDEKYAQMKDVLEWAAGRIWRCYRVCDEMRTAWRALGISGSGNAQHIPNDSAELIFDNSDRTAQDPNRPMINGQDVRRLLWRAEEFSNWAVYDNAGLPVWVNEGGITTEAITRTRIEDVYQMHTSILPPTGAKANSFVSRCTEIQDEYVTNNAGKFSQILAVAVNPGPQTQV